MIYIMGDIHGADFAYNEMKKIIGFTSEDELYLLGDVLDGNNNDPAACARILDDVMNHDNIHMLMGNHEHLHLLLQDQPETYCTPDILNDSRLQCGPFHRFLEEKCTGEEKKKYVDFLRGLELFEGIEMGGYILCLTHAEPIDVNDPDPHRYLWNKPSLNKDYSSDIKNLFPSLYNTSKPVYLIAGHAPTHLYFDEIPYLLGQYYSNSDETKIQKPIYFRDKIMMDCGCRGNSLGNAYGGWRSDLCCIGLEEKEETVEITVFSYNAKAATDKFELGYDYLNPRLLAAGKTLKAELSYVDSTKDKHGAIRQFELFLKVERLYDKEDDPFVKIKELIVNKSVIYNKDKPDRSVECVCDLDYMGDIPGFELYWTDKKNREIQITLTPSFFEKGFFCEDVDDPRLRIHTFRIVFEVWNEDFDEVIEEFSEAIIELDEATGEYQVTRAAHSMT